jgi:hypothetical protein
VAVLKADFSQVPSSEFEIVATSHGEHYKVEYDIEMTFEAMISFKLKYKGMCTSG